MWERIAERIADIINWLPFTGADKYAEPHCYLDNRAFIHGMATSDALIGFAYMILSIGAIYQLLYYRDRIFVKTKIFLVLFSLFVSCCGFTHFWGVYTLYYPDYKTALFVNEVCVFFSWLTVVVLGYIEFRTRLKPTKKEYQMLAEKVEEVARKHGLDKES